MRRHRNKGLPFRPPTEQPSNQRGVSSLVASAVNVRVTQGFQNTRWGATEWQQEAWLHYDTCPEFSSGVTLIANACSRARLIGVDIDPVTGDPAEQASTDPDVADIMSQLFGGVSGQSQALHTLAQHLTVAGDCWALATDDPDLDQSTWEILSTSAVTATSATQIMVEQMNGIPRRLDVDNELLMRLWRPHPKRRWEADAATRALLPVLRELAALTAMVSATVKSRLSSAGILWIPEEITLPKPTPAKADDDTQGRSESAGAAAWLDLITEAMVAPIRDPDSASAVVPMISTVKGDLIEKIKHMEFGRDLDQMIEPLRESCVKRLSVGMDLPPAKLLGIETANHWTGWLISEDFAREYLSPLLELIADAITRFYLRPALEARGRRAGMFAVYFDLSRLFPRQVSIDNATKAYEAGLLAEDEYLEALGFSVGQKASSEERARRLIMELVQHGNPQTLAEIGAAITALFPGIVIQPITATGGLGAPISGTEPKAIAGQTEPTPTAATNAPPAGPTSEPAGVGVPSG